MRDASLSQGLYRPRQERISFPEKQPIVVFRDPGRGMRVIRPQGPSVGLSSQPSNCPLQPFVQPVGQRARPEPV